jgi:hypothetical protein
MIKANFPRRGRGDLHIEEERELYQPLALRFTHR